MHFVLDGSVAISWAFEDEQTVETAAILDDLQNGSSEVPAIWPTEVANALLTGIKKGRLTVAQAREFALTLSRCNIAVHPPALFSLNLIERAQQHNLTVYDASYLSLAEEHNLPLATLDNAMRSAALKAGGQAAPLMSR